MTKAKLSVEATVVEVVEEVTPPTQHTVDVGAIRPKSSFGKTFYYVDLKRARASKGPQQLRDMVQYMIDQGMTSPETAAQGAAIGTLAVASGAVKTNKLTGPVIFAYYVRRMETEFGVEHHQTVHAKSGKVMA